MNSILRILTALTLVSGISLSVANTAPSLQGEVTGQGSSLELHPAATETVKNTLPPQMQIATAIYQPANASDELVVGILLIMLGFFLHALVLSRESRKVHVTSIPRKEAKPRTRDLFWVEMRM